MTKIRERVRQDRLKGADKIGVAVGKDMDRYKVGKHLVVKIDERHFDYQRDLERMAKEAALDGVHVIRTNVEAE